MTICYKNYLKNLFVNNYLLNKMLVSLHNRLTNRSKVNVKTVIFRVINVLLILYFFTYTKLTRFIPLINISANFTQYIY